MNLSEDHKRWIIRHFRNTKNDAIMEKLGISHSTLHRFAREQGLRKTRQFQTKCQLNASAFARKANLKNNWPPKGFIIPRSEEFRFKPGITPEQRLGKERNDERIAQLNREEKPYRARSAGYSLGCDGR